MGIRLDWEIEAEEKEIRVGGEDPLTARARRLARFRLLLLVGILLGIIGLIIGVVMLRLREVENQIEQLLRSTVEAEVAALRIGDWPGFESIQRSGDIPWMAARKNVFDEYQTLKNDAEVQLTGRILDIEVNEQRGRVHVEEIIGGMPYTRVWFYWRYSEEPISQGDTNEEKAEKLKSGWRHVPPDHEFWGEARVFEGTGLTILYNRVDEPLVLQMGPGIDQWLEDGCVVLGCTDLPAMIVEVVSTGGAEPGWVENDPWRLQLLSPYVGRARSDIPFDTTLRVRIADLLAKRLVEQASPALPIYPADSFYLRSAIVSWLVGRFAEINTNSFLISSLANNYGDQAVGVLAEFLGPETDASVLAAVSGVNALDQANLDWRDFLTWRLITEEELMIRGDATHYIELYDTNDEAVRTTAYSRYNTDLVREQKVVVLALPEVTAEGLPQLRATVQVGKEGNLRQEEVLFRLVNNVWRRAS